MQIENIKLKALDEAKKISQNGWRTVRFGDVVRNVKVDVDPETSRLERYIAGEHMETDNLHIRSWGLIGDGYLGPAFHRKFVKGQVLYGSRRTYLRKVAVAEFDGICANTTFVLDPKTDELLPELLPFIMQTESFNEHSIKQSRGSVNPYVNFTDIDWYEFALPPLDEQRRIAEVLWTLDETIEKFKNSYKSQEQLKQSLALKIFTKNYGNETSLGLVGNWSSGGTPSKSRIDFWKGEIPWVSPKDMKTDYLVDAIDKVSEEAVRSGSRMIPENSILIVVRGMILAHTFPVAMTKRPMAFNQDMKALVVSDEFDCNFVFYWLQSKANDILNLASETSHGTKRLPSETLFQLSVPKPSLEQQTKSALSLQKCDEALKLLNSHYQMLFRLKSQLLVNLLSTKTYVQ